MVTPAPPPWQRQLGDTRNRGLPLNVPLHSPLPTRKGASSPDTSASASCTRPLTSGGSLSIRPSRPGSPKLGINGREKFTITRKPAGRKGAPDIWEVARVPGEQPNGTLVLPNDGRPEPNPPQRASSAGASLVDQANDLVDAFAQVLERALTQAWRQGEAGRSTRHLPDGGDQRQQRAGGVEGRRRAKREHQKRTAANAISSSICETRANSTGVSPGTS